MRRLAIHQILANLAVPALLLTLVIDVTAGPPPIRTANSRQVTPTPLNTPLPPAPEPSALPSPGGTLLPAIPPAPVPSPMVPFPMVPFPIVPSPDPGGLMYSQPMGTMRERVPPPKVYLGDPNGEGLYHSPTDALPPSGQPLPALDPNAPLAATDRFGVAPPAGTLGHTYHRRTRLLDDKKHPRVGVVEVHLSENYDVSGKGLKSKWTGKVWELESDPLLPGVPHIFEIKAEWGPVGAREKEVRTVRLVMGRAVDLEF